MGKVAPDAVMDAAFDYVDQSTEQTICSAVPTTYTEAHTTFKLAAVTMTADTDYTKADGDVSGRKVTVAAKSGISVASSGTATHIALTRVADSSLRYVTTCTSQALTSGNTVNIPAWDIEIADPT